MCKNPRTEILWPSLLHPVILQAEPILEKLRIERLDPIWRKPNTEAEDPNLMKDLTLQLEAI